LKCFTCNEFNVDIDDDAYEKILGASAYKIERGFKDNTQMIDSLIANYINKKMGIELLPDLFISKAISTEILESIPELSNSNIYSLSYDRLLEILHKTESYKKQCILEGEKYSDLSFIQYDSQLMDYINSIPDSDRNKMDKVKKRIKKIVQKRRTLLRNTTEDIRKELYSAPKLQSIESNLRKTARKDLTKTLVFCYAERTHSKSDIANKINGIFVTKWVDNLTLGYSEQDDPIIQKLNKAINEYSNTNKSLLLELAKIKMNRKKTQNTDSQNPSELDLLIAESEEDFSAEKTAHPDRDYDTYEMDEDLSLSNSIDNSTGMFDVESSAKNLEEYVIETLKRLDLLPPDFVTLDSDVVLKRSFVEFVSSLKEEELDELIKSVASGLNVTVASGILTSTIPPQQRQLFLQSKSKDKSTSGQSKLTTRIEALGSEIYNKFQGVINPLFRRRKTYQAMRFTRIVGVPWPDFIPEELKSDLCKSAVAQVGSVNEFTYSKSVETDLICEIENRGTKPEEAKKIVQTVLQGARNIKPINMSLIKSLLDDGVDIHDAIRIALVVAPGELGNFPTELDMPYKINSFGNQCEIANTAVGELTSTEYFNRALAMKISQAVVQQRLKAAKDYTYYTDTLFNIVQKTASNARLQGSTSFDFAFTGSNTVPFAKWLASTICPVPV
jgi:hypothetical protein